MQDMPELTAAHLPVLLDQNKEIYHEVESVVRKYFRDHFQRGWTIVEGTQKWIEDNHHLLQAPIQDASLGGFIYFQTTRHICYVNTWQPRVYQNFMILHELYHLLTGTGLTTQQPLHLVEPDMDESMDERKADYFASLLLIDGNDLKEFVSSLKDRRLEEVVFYCMARFGAPYKAVLIRMFELNLLSSDNLITMFDNKYEYEIEFDKIGIDKACIQRSNLIKFDRLEEIMAEHDLPETAKRLNLETFQAVKKYFQQQEG
jgi:Zn-dependent peptidase ImmA (M78 family)